jgi:hypothetical protein
MTNATFDKKAIQFPSLPDEEAVKVKKMLDTMGEFMGVEFKVSEVRALNIEFDADRSDVAQILSRIASAKREAMGLNREKKAKAG